MLYRIFLILLFCLHASSISYARVGGGGGHSSSGSHSSHSSYSSGHSGSSGGSDSPFSVTLFVVFACVVIISLFSNDKKASQTDAVDSAPVRPAITFPAGIDVEKVSTAFFAIQDAWSRKDLRAVRKWLSDGMYQRLTTQFVMMDKLDQTNELSNISIGRIAAVNVDTDNNYQIVEVAISFEMDDSFYSNRYPQFNESYQSDADTEYWTFIKRTDSISEKNLYDNANCPNCGAPFEVKMGEISRCANCDTLTNSAAYDWVLSEITQAEAYRVGDNLADSSELSELLHTDPFFAVQRMEDIAANVFMQVMKVLTGGDDGALARFADERTTAAIVRQKQSLGSFLFDRLYLDSVTLSNYRAEGDVVVLNFDIYMNYRRVAENAGQLQMIDIDFLTQHCTLQLSRNKDVFTKAGVGETVYSYECRSCGAPFTDTTDDRCTYCDEPVVDKKKSWVLTDLGWGKARLTS